MYLRAIVVGTIMFAAQPAQAEISVTRGTNLSVDVNSDGRLAIDLLGDIWAVPAGGGDATQLTHDLGTAQRPRWSPDGLKLVYQATAAGSHGLWVYEFATGSSTNVSGESYFDLYPTWHPDGDRLTYASDRTGEGFDLWEVDLPTGLHWRLSGQPGDETEPAWSSDGKDLVYVHRLQNRWSLVLRRHGQPEEIIITTTDRLAAPSWRPDGSLITYLRGSAASTTIEMAILSQPRLIRPFETNEDVTVAAVSWLDRQQMYYSANGIIRHRSFNAWSSSPVPFRASIKPRETMPVAQQERRELPWLDEPGGRLIIHAARMFDGIGGGYQHDRDIVIEGGRIVAVEDHQQRSDVIIIDLGDLTILPGFIDADARLPADLSTSHGPELLAKGLTTLVASHGDVEQLNTLWSGKGVPGPRLLATNDWPLAPVSRPELDVTSAVIGSNGTALPAGDALGAAFRTLTMAGLTPEQMLRAIGVNAAAALRADPFLGRIATGAAADLVFVDGDPLADINSALNVIAVVRNGRFFSLSGLKDRAEIAKSVE